MVRRTYGMITLLFGIASAQWARADIAFEEEPLIDRLDETTRAKVILALAGLVMLGVLMMGLTWLAFRMLRKQFRRTEDVIRRQNSSPQEDDWTRKPLSERKSVSESGDA